MASQLLEQRSRELLTAAVTEIASEEADEGSKKAAGLRAKVMKLRGEILRQAIAREKMMHDRDETVAIAAALKALEGGDVAAATALLRERVEQVKQRRRRAAVRDSDSDDCDDEDSCTTHRSDGECGQPATDVAALMSQDEPASEAWAALVDGQLSTLGLRNASSTWPVQRAGESMIHDLASQLKVGGYILGHSLPGVPEIAAKIKSGMQMLRAANIEPFYIWMYDEPWQLLCSYWSLAEALLGGECWLEPTFAAYHLDRQAAARHKGKYVGTNFGLPHRDYTYTDSHTSDGRAKILTMWVPVNDVTVENGCMYVVPKEFDDNFAGDAVYEHMMVQSTGWLKGKSHVSFPLAGLRPLAPAKAGCICGWYGNIIHWGGNCHSGAQTRPRASLAWVFRLAADAHHTCEAPLCRSAIENLDLPQRRALLRGSMAYFEHWTGPTKHVMGQKSGATLET